MDLNKYDYFVVRYEMTDVAVQFPIGTKVKIVKPCVFSGKVGRVIGHGFECVELEIVEQTLHEGKMYNLVGTSLPPSWLEKA